MSEQKLHSAAYFGEQRDFWWHPDFLALMAKRWALSNVKTILDVGSGQGHWGTLVLPFADPKATLIGIEPESKWREIAYQNAERYQIRDRVQYQEGVVEKLPFADNSFDMVTCQTVLIHVADPLVALAEMKRVLKPGGLLVTVEPNNAIPMLVHNNINWDDPVEEITEMVAFQLTCEKGKQVLKEGNNLRGDLLVYYFDQIHMHGIQSYLSDMADYLIPPYESPREKAVIEAYKNLVQNHHYLWDKEDTQRYFIAGGGSLENFEKLWALMEVSTQKYWQAMQKNQFYCSGGALFYLTSGRK